MPQLNAIGIVAADMAQSMRFYRLLGARRSRDAEEGHVDDVPAERRPPHARHRGDVITSFRPDWTRATGQPDRARLRVRRAPRRSTRSTRASSPPASTARRSRGTRSGASATRSSRIPDGGRRRPLRRALNSTRTTSSSPGGQRRRSLRPPSADELIDEAAFDEDEFLPYWAELWPSGVALARSSRRSTLRGRRVLELGCGLGLPSLAAALRGADVLATDWAEDAIELLRANAERNGIALRVGARALGRAGAAAARSAVGRRPRRRPSLRGAERRAAARASAAARRRGRSSPSRAARSRRRSSSAGTSSRSPSGSTGCGYREPMFAALALAARARRAAEAAHRLEADPVRRARA